MCQKNLCVYRGSFVYDCVVYCLWRFYTGVLTYTGYTMCMDTTVLLDFACTMARDAGVIMLDYFNRANKGVQTKADKTHVTEADKAINQLVIERVAATFPTHGVLGEEVSDNADRNELWVCDPIDGTEGFILGVPTSMFSLAFTVRGEPFVAVTYDPFQDRLYHAVKGSGAYMNGQPIHVCENQSLDGLTVGVTGGFRQIISAQELLKEFVRQGARIGMMPGNVYKGSLVARGLAGAQLFPGRSAHDIAANKLIVEESGGVVTDLQGNDQRYDQPIYGAIVSAPGVHKQIVAALEQFGTDNFIGF